MQFGKLNSLLEQMIDVSKAIQHEVDEISKEVNVEKKEEVKPSIDLDTLRGYLADMSRNGMTADVRQLLQQFGVEKLSQINSKDYDELYLRAEELRNGRE